MLSFTPHGDRFIPNYNRMIGAPMDRNLGYYDGHVEYMANQN